jgi:hypothetical protein
MPTSQQDDFSRARSPPPGRPRLESIYESQEALDDITEELHSRVENWHGLDFSRFVDTSGHRFNIFHTNYVFLLDSANFDFTALSGLAKIVNPGKNLNATCSPICSFV